MEETKYKELCKSCDEILKEGAFNPIRVSIPFLHIIREHPVFINNYKAIVTETVWLNRTLKGLGLLLKYTATFIKKLILSINSGEKQWYSNTVLKDNVDILFVSHLLKEEHVSLKDDFYFGKTPRILQEKGYEVVVVLINHTDQKSKLLSVNFPKDGVPKLLLSDTLKFTDEIGIFLKECRGSLQLLKNRFFLKDSLKKKIAIRSAIEIFSGTTSNTLRIYEQLLSISFGRNVKSAIVTFEGHAWERIAFSAFRLSNPSCICMGYQHSILFRLQHSIRRNLYAECDPDIIFTSGKVSLNQFNANNGITHPKILLLGSERGIESSFDHTVTDTFLKKKCCLVLPEGIMSECGLLFEFSYSSAIAYPDVTFIWRLHPVISFESVFENFPAIRSLPDNIQISNQTIEQDFELSKWVLYRGTTAVIKALGNGLKPIYYSQSDEMVIDPLADLNYWHNTVQDISALMKVFNEERKMSQTTFYMDFLEAQRYCENIFTPFQIENLESVLLKPI